jgi:hypothetical protein
MWEPQIQHEQYKCELNVTPKRRFLVTWRNIIHSHSRENLKSDTALTGWAM